MKRRLLSIYLNDHLAGSTAGRDLARRVATSNRGTAYGAPLARIADEIVEDRDTLLRVMRALEVRPDQLKVALGWTAVRLGRLKLNGQLTGYSPLSRVVEIEGLAIGVRGKLALWTALQRLEGVESRLATFDLAALAQRAMGQLDELERLRLAAVDEALAGRADEPLLGDAPSG